MSIDPSEAVVVRQIFELYASGLSLRGVAKQLTSTGIPAPRSGRSAHRGVWPYTGIREMLRRELYAGILIWNKRKYLKNPGTNKRVSRLRPESEWIRLDMPELRIISSELWSDVQTRLLQNSTEFDRRNGSLRRISRPRLE